MTTTLFGVETGEKHKKKAKIDKGLARKIYSGAMRSGFKCSAFVSQPTRTLSHKPFTSFIWLQRFSRTWDCPTQVTIPEQEMIMPGEDAKLVLRSIRTMVLEQGQRFTLRDGHLTLGTGVVSKVLSPLSETERLADFIGENSLMPAACASIRHGDDLCQGGIHWDPRVLYQVIVNTSLLRQETTHPRSCCQSIMLSPCLDEELLASGH